MKLFLRTFVAVLAMAFASTAYAVTIDPDTGGSGTFRWDGGLGDSVEFPTFGADDTLDITVSQDSFIDFSVLDCCVVGDAFALVVDGSVVAWDSDGFTGPGGLYEGAATIFLSAGAHTIDLLITADCCGAGFGTWEASAARVPVPASLPLLLIALGSVAYIRRKQV